MRTDRVVLPQPSTFIATRALIDVGGVRPDLHYVMDWELYLRLALRFGPRLRVVTTDILLSRAVQHEAAKAARHPERFAREARTVVLESIRDWPARDRWWGARWLRSAAMRELLSQAVARDDGKIGALLKIPVQFPGALGSRFFWGGVRRAMRPRRALGTPRNRPAGAAAGPLVSTLLRAYFLGPDHPMKLRVYWWIRRAMQRRRLTIRYGGSGWITVDERDFISASVLRTGGYEPEVWSTVAGLLGCDEVVWDIGANIGTFSVLAILDRRVRALRSFEPDPRNAAVLRHNLSLNSGNYTVHELALSDSPGHGALYLAPALNMGLSSLAGAPSGDGDRVLVECRTVDQMVFSEGLEPPTIVKMDVEDWELRVFRGMRRLLREYPPRAIVFEAAADSRGNVRDCDLTELLRDSGYRVQWMRRPDGSIESRENYLALPVTARRRP